jgi:glycosyltransferase involved in cell wall biosynthesis
MLFSVVIPTHNRLHLLRDAIETVRRQKWGNWELVVFDNASSDPVRDHIEKLNDDRIRYDRSNEFLPVTDSWNRAIGAAHGEYVILLGDDDGLTPDYFIKIMKIIEDFDSPEIIYAAIFQFMHPGVAPWDREGYVADVKNGFFFSDKRAPFLLSVADARRAVIGSLHLRRNFTFNIQAFVFKNEFVTRLCQDGPFFRSSFPDYYLANVALVRSRSVVVVPEPLAIAGVSRASFGFTLFNNLEDKGEALLNARLTEDPIYRDVESKLLPGPAYQTNYIVAMEYVARATSSILFEQVNFDRYRRLQIFTVLKAVQTGLPLAKVWPALRQRLTNTERAWARMFAVMLVAGEHARFFKRTAVAILENSISPYSFQPVQRICDRGHFSRVLQVYEAIASGAIR